MPTDKLPASHDVVETRLQLASAPQSRPRCGRLRRRILPTTLLAIAALLAVRCGGLDHCHIAENTTVESGILAADKEAIQGKVCETLLQYSTYKGELRLAKIGESGSLAGGVEYKSGSLAVGVEYVTRRSSRRDINNELMRIFIALFASDVKITFAAITVYKNIESNLGLWRDRPLALASVNAVDMAALLLVVETTGDMPPDPFWDVHPLHSSWYALQ